MVGREVPPHNCEAMKMVWQGGRYLPAIAKSRRNDEDDLIAFCTCSFIGKKIYVKYNKNLACRGIGTKAHPPPFSVLPDLVVGSCCGLGVAVVVVVSG